MGEWIEHTGDCIPVKHGDMVIVRRRNGVVMGPFSYGYVDVDGNSTLPDDCFTSFLWATCPEWAEYHVIAYRLHDDGQSETETRKARMDQFYKIAAGRDHLIEETLKTRKPVSAPQKAGE